MSYIKFENIVKEFNGNRVLKGISLEVERGDFVTLLGPSGCGKSTLLRCLAGLEQVTAGRIYLDGKDITDFEAKEREIGMVFQHYSLFPNMNVFENISFGLKMKHMPKAEAEERVAKVINMVDLKGKEKSMPQQLSGGQQQRVALARSIVTEPKVLLLDEPLSAIDAKLRKTLQKEIRKIQKEMGITTIFVTHDQDEAMIMSDVIHLLNAGNVEQSGTPIQMYTMPNTPFAAGFMGNYNIFPLENFCRMTGCQRFFASEVAVRPETVELSNEFKKAEHSYQFTGRIVESTVRGNVLRYKILSGNEDIYADALFRSKALFENGSEVHITISERNCIKL